ncbi:MAG: hypothetical protein KAJ62_13245 [Desulfobacteraceae bacterium]|nr:hypothetical protein [Desulfobacteraceae bacterium]
MSDKVKDGFEPINLSSLEIYDEERNSRGKAEELDWNKFKVFFEELKSESKETAIFKPLFDQEGAIEKKEKIKFQQLGEDQVEAESDVTKEFDRESEDLITETDKPELGSMEGVPQAENSESGNGLTDSNQSYHDQDYAHGYDQGFENGKKDGHTKGFEQGKKDGHEQGVKEGYSEGYAKGETESVKETNEKFAEKVEEFEEILLKLDNTYQELAARYEEKLISLICLIAEKVVLAKVEIDDEIVKATVIDALKTLPEPEDITLNVSDEDYEYLEMVKEDLFGSIKSLKSVSVKSDASVHRGGCRIETKEGYIETDIESKLEKIFLSIKGKHEI